MINHIAACGPQALGLHSPSQTRSKKSEPTQEPAAEAPKAQKPAHPIHPHGHVPPGLARAAEKIASKIFSRADADASGTVTQEELSVVHSKHARTLASSDLFQSTPTDPEAPAQETPASTALSETQLKEALTKYFYAKVGVTYTPPPPPIVEPPAPVEPTDSTNEPTVTTVA